jgi:hypothetical protein
MEDTLASTPILITMEASRTTHFVLMREMEGKLMHFQTDSTGGLTDTENQVPLAA